MKTTLEIPDAILRRAKAKAAARGVPFRQFVTEAVEASLRSESSVFDRASFVGKLHHLHTETVRINKLIEAEFETIEPENWR